MRNQCHQEGNCSHSEDDDDESSLSMSPSMSGSPRHHQQECFDSISSPTTTLRQTTIEAAADIGDGSGVGVQTIVEIGRKSHHARPSSSTFNKEYKLQRKRLAIIGIAMILSVIGFNLLQLQVTKLYSTSKMKGGGSEDGGKQYLRSSNEQHQTKTKKRSFILNGLYVPPQVRYLNRILPNTSRKYYHNHFQHQSFLLQQTEEDDVTVEKNRQHQQNDADNNLFVPMSVKTIYQEQHEEDSSQVRPLTQDQQQQESTLTTTTTWKNMKAEPKTTTTSKNKRSRSVGGGGVKRGDRESNKSTVSNSYGGVKRGEKKATTSSGGSESDGDSDDDEGDYAQEQQRSTSSSQVATTIVEEKNNNANMTDGDIGLFVPSFKHEYRVNRRKKKRNQTPL